MKIFHLTFYVALTTSVLFAQEESGDISPASPKTPVSGEAPDAAPPAGDVATTGAAAKGSELDFVARSNFIFAKLIKSTRSIDPFGQQMDPANAKESPMLAEQYADVEETPTLNNSALKSALMTLPITGIYPQRNVIVIGARSFTPGGQFGMKLQELTIRLRFEGVRGKEIFFKDMETQETTSIEFNPLPQEFEPLTNAGPQAPGSGIVSMNELFIAN